MDEARLRVWGGLLFLRADEGGLCEARFVQPSRLLPPENSSPEVLPIEVSPSKVSPSEVLPHPSPVPQLEGNSGSVANPHLRAGINWFRAYFGGKFNSSGSNTLNPPKLHLKGSDFQKKVWAELATIGTTATYKQIASRLATAPRAVGRAAASNRLWIIIPCHRLVAVGGLGGYAGGLALKARLLEFEGNLPKGVWS